MIYDCFLFRDELDMLEIRLNVLDGVVDRFLILETNKTFSGIEKPYNLADNFKRYEKFKDKILYARFENPPDLPQIWDRETFHRNLMSEMLFKNANLFDNDHFMCSDLDEIPDPKQVEKYVMEGDYQPKCFVLRNFMYGINLENQTYNDWHGPVIMPYKDFLKHKIPDGNVQSFLDKNLGFQGFREMRHKIPQMRGGWHYTYCMGIEDIKRKVASDCHSLDLDTPEINCDEHILKAIANLTSLNPDGPKGDKIKLKKISLEEATPPKYIVDNLDKYSHLIR